VAARATVQRAILRAIQRDPNITRSHLSVQIRPYASDWDAVLESLIAKGLVLRATEIRRPGDGWTAQRSFVVYNLAPGSHPPFDSIPPEDVTHYVKEWVPQQTAEA
jgi:hypothetical protein